jgi:pimeloyl-ACP methyl ester carboxylesterase
MKKILILVIIILFILPVIVSCESKEEIGGININDGFDVNVLNDNDNDADDLIKKPLSFVPAMIEKSFFEENVLTAIPNDSKDRRLIESYYTLMDTDYVLDSNASQREKDELLRVFREYTDVTENDFEIFAGSSEIMEIESFDGYLLKGRLVIPHGKKKLDKLVILVNGSGPNTYINRRTGFNFYDTFSDEFSKLGVALFSYNTRGVDLGNDPPMYADINEEEYKTYLPLNQVEDIYYMINAIKENERLKDSKIYLLGLSEGTIIAPLVAEKYPDKVDGLFLWGYANQNMKDVLVWQNTGGPSMVWYRANFETDEYGRISRESYESDPNDVIVSVLQNATFASIDNNNDGFITEEDFAVIWKDIVGYTLEDLLNAIEQRDDEWLRKNYGAANGVSIIPLTSAWFLEHFSLRSNMGVLPGLNLPIHIFHGTLDQNVDVREVYKINEKFQELGKNNLVINVFENHNHDLNFNPQQISAGIQAIFDAIMDME